MDISLTCQCGAELASDASDDTEELDGITECDCGARYVLTVTTVVPPEAR